MFEAIGQTYSTHSGFVNGVASTLTILLFIRGLFVLAATRNKVITRSSHRYEIVPHLHHPEIIISIQSPNGLGKRLVKDLHCIVNRTDVTLTDSDFVEPPSFMRSYGAVYAVKMLSGDSKGRAKVTIEDNRVALTDVVIPRLSGVFFEIYHEGIVKKARR